MIKDYDLFVKLVLIGSSGVGKSSILTQFAENRFNEGYFTTIGVDFRFKTMKVQDKYIKFQIWDTAGQQRFRTITSAYYKGADGVIVVYDITDQNTFKDVQRFWSEQIVTYADQNVDVLLLGNKSDCPRAVRREQAANFAESKGYQFNEVSAKTADNLTESIKEFGRKVAQRKASRSSISSSQGQPKPEPTTSAILRTAEKTQMKKNSGCC